MMLAALLLTLLLLLSRRVGIGKGHSAGWEARQRVRPA